MEGPGSDGFNGCIDRPVARHDDDFGLGMPGFNLIQNIQSADGRQPEIANDKVKYNLLHSVEKGLSIAEGFYLITILAQTALDCSQGNGLIIDNRQP